MSSEERVKKRYFRKVMAHPDGAIVHHGDCYYWDRHICTCGLLHDLMPMSEPEKIYSKFWEESGKHEMRLTQLMGVPEIPIQPVSDEDAQKFLEDLKAAGWRESSGPVVLRSE